MVAAPVVVAEPYPAVVAVGPGEVHRRRSYRAALSRVVHGARRLRVGRRAACGGCIGGVACHAPAETTGEDTGSSCQQQEGSRLTTREALDFIQQRAGIPAFQPLGNRGGTLCCLLDQVRGDATVLA